MPELSGVLLSGLPFTPGVGDVLLGGFHLRAQAEIGVWRRLFEQTPSAPVCWTVYFLGVGEAEHLRAMTPKSLWDRTAICTATEAWADLVRPDRVERSFAALVGTEGLNPLMVGIPTEEAWDRFLESL